MTIGELIAWAEEYEINCDAPLWVHRPGFSSHAQVLGASLTKLTDSCPTCRQPRKAEQVVLCLG